jgi:hypothetical protein
VKGHDTTAASPPADGSPLLTKAAGAGTFIVDGTRDDGMTPGTGGPLGVLD